MDNQIIFNEEIFKPNFPLDGAHLVAASAGTGKTYNIQNIYARLVMEKGWRVSEIQVMTFTDAATKELRERLRAVLVDIQACLNHETCMGKDEADATRRNERADRLIAACQGKTDVEKMNAIGLALLEFDSAAISTIHGFCSRALARFAFETRMTFNPEIQDNKAEELARLALDWWRKREENTPNALLPQLNLGILLNYVKVLGDKTDWKIIDSDENDPSGFMLARAAEIVQAYENDRTNRQTQTYDDLLRSMREALNGPFGDSFAAKLRETFHAALIDEFQDTDPVQYDIFRKVFLADESIPVFLVGDPKQAIYAFRGGDIFTYRAAAKGMKRKYYLDTNYRSTPRLMAAVNAIFRDAGEIGATFGDSEIGYPNDIRAIDKKALQVDGEDDPSPFRFVEVVPQKNTKVEALDTVLAREVVKTLTEYDGVLSPKDIAILVAKKYHAKTIMAELRKCGVPCVIQNPGNVFTRVIGGFGNAAYLPSRMLREFLSVCLAMAKTGGVSQLRAALATSFFGLTPMEIMELDEESLAKWIGSFDDLNHIWLKRGLGAALAKMEEYGTRHGVGYRERLAMLPDGERLLADCGQIIELAFAAVKEIGPSPEKLIAWLKDRVANGDKEDDSDAYARELESDSNAVRIMTMHVSKGLQFPVVFLPDCNVKAKKKKKGEAACYHDEKQDNQLVFSTASPEREEAEEEQEKLRLLYVAMTRAEQRTVAFYYAATDRYHKINPPLQKLMDNAAKNGAGKDAVGSPIQWLRDNGVSGESLKYLAKSSTLVLKKPNAPRMFDAKPSRGSYSSVSPSLGKGDFSAGDWEGRDVDSEDKKAAETDLFSEKQPVFQIRGGANIGSCWHEVLENIAFDASDEEIRKVAVVKLREYGFDPLAAAGSKSFLEVSCEMIAKTLERPIAAPNGRLFTLRDVHWQERMSELEFNFTSAFSAKNTVVLAETIRRHWGSDSTKQEFLKALDGWNREIPKGFINGFIDLVFQHDGYFYVVDWKSNSLGGVPESFTEEGVRREMASHGYFLQYLLYSAVLQRYLKDLPGFGYSWEKHFGGIRYYFLRGIDVGKEAAVFADRSCEGLLDEIGKVLGMEVE
ncbi:MAG: UvrD-helicase domain-containing protein [Victivallales bacterium]|nr:UvrD-helicase domain-containing protein [Victivallales bacterium]